MRQLTLTTGAAVAAWNPFAGLRGFLENVMLAITTSMATSFKRELFEARHNMAVGAHNFRVALFDATATMDATTANYSAANEVVGTGYVAGGKVLTNAGVAVSGTTAFADFDDVVWTGSTFTARGAQIFNADQANRSCGVFDFGQNIPVVAGNFTLTFPTANATAAVFRIA
jgi:hypothetical protein